MNQPAQRPACYDDLFDLPEQVTGEIISGVLHTQPRPTPRHALALSTLGGRLGSGYQWGKGPGGWWILDEPELHLSGDILVPDLAGWRKERMPSIPKTAWFELAPDWVCEVLSPATARNDRFLKMPAYAREGIAHIWLVDPMARTLEIYALQDNSHWLLLTTLADSNEVCQPPFDTIGFPLDDLWA